ncbi:unnamed protein product [Protopolystoma xenopodis]|uniref:Uncharacterized protein n=1 Tax=Protopolystoma xenopodis TaxID=117903 RepID=A0A3S5CML2_9PLAT|nr:unnamed protein product [Protopolystoma xenopodis]
MSLGPKTLIECMAAAGLPSTLVKCLYIFLDLPPQENAESSQCRLRFQATFRNLLQRICLHHEAAEEIARKDALRYLFSAAADWCPPHNKYWRHSTVAVLSTLAQNSISSVVIHYVHNSGCMAECLKNIKNRLLPCEAVDSFITLLHFLRESSIISQTILDDFRENQGYLQAGDFLLK